MLDNNAAAAAGMGTAMAVFSQTGGIAREIQQKKSPRKWRIISSIYIKTDVFWIIAINVLLY